MRLKGFQTVKKQQKDNISAGKLNWLFIVIFSFLTKLGMNFHTIPYILPIKWSAREPGSYATTTRSRQWDGFLLIVRTKVYLTKKVALCLEKVELCMFGLVALKSIVKSFAGK